MGLEGARLDPSSGTPNSALTGLQKQLLSLSACQDDIKSVEIFMLFMVNFPNNIQDYTRTFVDLRVWLSRRLYSKDSKDVVNVAND